MESFTDDLTAIVDATPRALKRILYIFNRFTAIAGLPINVSKTQVVPLGTLSLVEVAQIKKVGVEVDSAFMVLGFFVDGEVKNRQKLGQHLEKNQ